MITDVGCDDFERAAINRNMVANHWCIKGYLDVEIALKSTPLSKPLPSWIPTGDLATLNDRKELKAHGFHEIKD